MKTYKVTVSVSFDWDVSDKDYQDCLNGLLRRPADYWMGAALESLEDETATFEQVAIREKYLDDGKQEELL